MSMSGRKIFKNPCARATPCGEPHFQGPPVGSGMNWRGDEVREMRYWRMNTSQQHYEDNERCMALEYVLVLSINSSQCVMARAN